MAQAGVTSAWLVVAVAGVLAGAPTASGEGGFAGELEAARARAKAGDVVRAAGHAAAAAAAAQARGDLPGEGEAADVFCGLSLPQDPRPALAAAMERLEPARHGAFVSAGALAGAILLEAAERGDALHVEEAAAVVTAAAGSGKSGAWLGAMARFAAGMRASRAGAHDRAVDPLGAAQRAARDEGWGELEVLAAAERAAALLAAGNTDGARLALVDAAAAIGPDAPPRLRNLLLSMARRFEGAPESVRKPLDDAVAALPSAGGAGLPGGAGGAGLSGADRARSKVGEALRSAPRTKALVTATRGDDGFEMRVLWDAKHVGRCRTDEGGRHLDHGGLTLAFHGQAVALRVVDTVGNRGQPGVDADPDPCRAWYRLARGESWRLFRDGTVTVERAK